TNAADAPLGARLTGAESVMAKLSWLAVIGFSALLTAASAWAQSGTPTPSRNLSDYVVFAVRPTASLKSEKASLGDDSFVAEGHVGVNDQTQTGLTTSVTFGKAVYMADGAQVVTDQFTGSISAGAPDSVSDLFANTCKNGCPPPNVTIRDVMAT